MILSADLDGHNSIRRYQMPCSYIFFLFSPSSNIQAPLSFLFIPKTVKEAHLHLGVSAVLLVLPGVVNCDSDWCFQLFDFPPGPHHPKMFKHVQAYASHVGSRMDRRLNSFFEING